MALDPLTIRADWDDEAAVWVVSSPDVPGLCVKADAIEDLEHKARIVMEDLAEFEPEVAALLGRGVECRARTRRAGFSPPSPRGAALEMPRRVAG